MPSASARAQSAAFLNWPLTCAALILAVGLSACGPRVSTRTNTDQAGLPDALRTDSDFQTILQTALAGAKPGETIRLPEGVFKLREGLTLDVDGVTLIGAGQEKTILDFSDQALLGSGLTVTADDVTLMDFGVRDAKGDGITSSSANRIIYRYLTIDWPGSPDEANGAHGVSPVGSTDVLIENITVRGASDAGIHVGQSENIIVRNSVAEFNVTGIEIENTRNADVYGNVVKDNAVGLLVSDQPGLQVTGGHSIRIANNLIERNNTRNFAAPGDSVSGVPSGTGLIVQASRNVHVLDNDFADNRSTHILLSAYNLPFTDARFNPLPRDVLVRDNRFSGGGHDPQGALQPLAMAFGGKLPEIVTDGVTRWPGKPAQTVNLQIEEPDSVGFVNFGMAAYPADPKQIKPSATRPKGTPIQPLEPVTLPHEKR